MTAIRYVISEGHRTVLDTETRLEWRQDPEPGLYTYEEALVHAEKVGNGWRLPTVRELYSLVEWGLAGAKIDLQAFPNCPASFCWASTTMNSLKNSWGVDFSSGMESLESQSNCHYVRLVREFSPRYCSKQRGDNS